MHSNEYVTWEATSSTRYHSEGDMPDKKSKAGSGEVWMVALFIGCWCGFILGLAWLCRYYGVID